MISLVGSYTSALTHFAGYGLAAILEEAENHDLLLRWSETDEPTLTLDGIGEVSGNLTRSSSAEAGHERRCISTPDGKPQVGELVRDHARRHADPASWVQRTIKVKRGAKKVDVGLFSPRIAAPETAHAWQEIYAERQRVLDDPINRTWLDGQMLQALGEPAYWQSGIKNPQYDEGASRWEMKTRNRGEDFVGKRLSSLAREVAVRDPVVIGEALTLGIINDSSGKADSRTGTGLVPPGPVDDAVAWCALWGISAFRLFPGMTGVAVTPGAWPTDRVHPGMMALPMYTTAQSPAKLRRIIRSQDFSDSAFGRDGNAGSIATVRARQKLAAMGIRGLVKFPIRKAGSSSAPERQVLSGIFEPI